ncbi:MAG: phytoene desaturase family protein [Chromatiaceae bacterium]|jgi:1-hydroxycarotenoid 3,4-desaturase|nr:phytoene desaturase family protein [Chromatiaceae bacterium]
MSSHSARSRAIVVGAGIGGLACAIELAARGVAVEVFERSGAPGGKMREVAIGDARLDAGPTVFTMRWVLEELFASAGTELAAEVGLKPIEVLARHAWEDGGRLDLFADRARTADAISAFSGPGEGQRYLEFCQEAAGIYRTLEAPYIRAHRPSPVGLVGRVGPGGLGDLWRIKPFATLWSVLSRRFTDPRLRQLIGRYATYCGSSPFLAPATLMLIAHVEQEGVWLVEGGMHRLAQAMAQVADGLGARIHYRAPVAEVLIKDRRARGVRLDSGERVEAGTLIFNGDIAALAGGRLGADARRAVAPSALGTRSLSALTWNLVAPTEGFPLVRHTVFFSSDYAAEFEAIFRAGRLPTIPTVYICAQDRGDRGDWPEGQPERLLCLVNAPATGDTRPPSASEIEQCAERTFSLLERCGLKVRRDPHQSLVTTPARFAELFPATGGALYGQASHGWQASFTRPGSRSRIPGLYLAGGSTHPGAGVPMAAISGRLAASCVIEDLAST